LAYRETHTPNTRSHLAGGHNRFRRPDSLCCWNTNIIAVDIFHELFYDEFFKRYDVYGQLPMNWRKLKIQLAEDINVNLIKKYHVKSLGFGIGFIKGELDKITNAEITAVEPHVN